MRSLWRGFWLLLVAALCLLALLLLPQAGWLVRSQFRAQFLPPDDLVALLRDLGVKEGLPESGSKRDSDVQALARTAEWAPNDYPIQLANALTAPDSQEQVGRLRALVARFPDRASLRAHILRFATMGTVHVHRDEEFLLGNTTPPQTMSAAKHSTPEDLAAFDRDAEEGERLDPSNAYFPFMRAVGLFAAKSDAEALTALHRAASCPRFDDYAVDEVRSRLAADERLHGRSETIHRLMIQATLLFPHYAALRAVARVATYKAAIDEQAGRKEAGWAIRRDLMQCGRMMRVQSHSFIGSLVGIAISRTAHSRPGSSLGLVSNSNRSVEQTEAPHLQEFTAYLRNTGHAADVGWVEREDAADKAVKAISQGAFEATLIPALHRLGVQWSIDLILLANALRVLTLGLAGAALMRVVGRKGGDILVAFVLLFLLCLFFYTPIGLWCQAYRMMDQVISNLSGGNIGPSASSPSSPGMVRLSVTVFALLGSLALLLGVGIAGLVNRDASPPALTRRLRSAGLICGSLLLLAYCSCIPKTLQAEAGLNSYLEGTLQHEGQYFASHLGKEWPQ